MSDGTKPVENDDDFQIILPMTLEQGLAIERTPTDLYTALRLQAMDWNETGDHWQRHAVTIELMGLKGFHSAIVDDDPRTIPAAEPRPLLKTLTKTLSDKGIHDFTYLSAGVARVALTALDKEGKEVVVTLQLGHPPVRLTSDNMVTVMEQGEVAADGVTVGYEILEKLDTRVSPDEARAFIKRMAAAGEYVKDPVVKYYGYGAGNPGAEYKYGNLGKDAEGKLSCLTPIMYIKVQDLKILRLSYGNGNN